MEWVLDYSHPAIHTLKSSMFANKPLHIIEDDASLREVCETLLQSPIIGVDLESDSLHRYHEKVCLIQVSDNQSDYIIDPLKIRDLRPFLDIMEAEQPRKVMHGSDFDVVSLKRDYNIKINNLFDTLVAAQLLGYPNLGLASLIKRHFGIVIDKYYQKHDWSQRPLLPDHLDYARGDTHWLLALYELLGRKLRQKNFMEASLEESEFITQKEWTDRSGDPRRFLRIKKSNTLNEDGKKVLRTLWELREKLAEKMDRPSFKVVSDHVLLAFARSKPESLADMHKSVSSRSWLVKKHGRSILEAVEAGLADEREIPPPQPAPKKRNQNPNFDRVMMGLREWRQKKLDSKGFYAGILLSNGQLKEIARVCPRTLEELESTPLIRNWQSQLYALELLEVVEETCSKPKSKGRRRRKSS
jgi:ribonuclease D